MVLVVVTLTGLVFYIGPKHFRRATAIKGGTNRVHHQSQLYFQPKAELDTAENRKDELEAKEIRFELEPRERYEIEGGIARAEMAGFNGENGAIPSLMERHELRGEEHARELDGQQAEHC